VLHDRDGRLEVVLEPGGERLQRLEPTRRGADRDEARGPCIHAGPLPATGGRKRLAQAKTQCLARLVTDELVHLLGARVRSALARAQAAVAEADLLTTASRLLREPGSMARRCAWCGRIALGREWVPEDDVPKFVRSEL
jgi:hypothetical protein